MIGTFAWVSSVSSSVPPPPFLRLRHLLLPRSRETTVTKTDAQESSENSDAQRDLPEDTIGSSAEPELSSPDTFLMKVDVLSDTFDTDDTVTANVNVTDNSKITKSSDGVKNWISCDDNVSNVL